MTTEDKNKLIASIYRQTFYAKLMEYEQAFFLKMPLPGGVKNVLKRMKDNYQNSLAQLRSYLPLTTNNAATIAVIGDEKLRAISAINEKLFVLDLDQVLEIETSMEGIKISYEENENV